MQHTKSFHGVVRFNEEGELICFCYDTDVQTGRCGCLLLHDCSEAVVEVSIIAGTKPSEKNAKSLARASQGIEDIVDKVSESAGKIKQGLSALEKAIKRNTHFHI